MKIRRFKNIHQWLRAFIVLSLLGLGGATQSWGTEGWKIDLSRRHQDLQRFQTQRSPQSLSAPQGEKTPAESGGGFLDMFFSSPSGPVQDVVILNTDKGFIPAEMRMREDVTYKVHVVNVNDKAKNVSFVMDAFSEYHATYYGEIKSFILHPQKVGTFTYVCPETAVQGRLVVHPSSSENLPALELRAPASE